MTEEYSISLKGYELKKDNNKKAFILATTIISLGIIFVLWFTALSYPIVRIFGEKKNGEE